MWRHLPLVPGETVLHNFVWQFLHSTRYNEIHHTYGVTPAHCSGVIMSAMASRLFAQPFVGRRASKKTLKLRVTGLCEGIHRWPVDPPLKGLVTRKMFPFDDVIMGSSCKLIGTQPLKSSNWASLLRCQKRPNTPYTIPLLSYIHINKIFCRPNVGVLCYFTTFGYFLGSQLRGFFFSFRHLRIRTFIANA